MDQLLMDQRTFAKLPNFMILGVAKAGTTSLYHYLQQHPSIYLSNPKEPHFFDQRGDYLHNLKAYIDECFANAGSFPLRGEATPSYFSRPNLVAPRLREFYGDRPLKFIVCLRDPVARAWSHYLDRAGIGIETEDFETALKLEATRLKDPKAGWIGYFSDGLYAQHLKQWLEYYDLDRFHFLLTEELRQDGPGTVRQVLAFLGAEPNVTIDTSQMYNQAGRVQSRFAMMLTKQWPKTINRLGRLLLPGHYGMSNLQRWLRSRSRKAYAAPPQMSPSVEQELRRRYADEMVELSRLIDRDLSAWLPAAKNNNLPA